MLSILDFVHLKIFAQEHNCTVDVMYKMPDEVVVIKFKNLVTDKIWSWSSSFEILSKTLSTSTIVNTVIEEATEKLQLI